MEIFRYKKRLKLKYNVQGYIYFTCQNYNCLSECHKSVIDRICAEVGGDIYREALFSVITTNRSVVSISMEHHMSESALREKINQFYREYKKQGI